MLTFSLPRKVLTVTAATALLVGGLAGQASAVDGLTFYNRGAQKCMTVAPNSQVGSPVLVGACGTDSTKWRNVGGPGGDRLQNSVTGLCLEVPADGGYAFLQTCGGPMQAIDLTTPGMVFISNDADARVLEAEVATGRVRSADSTLELNQSWAFH